MLLWRRFQSYARRRHSERPMPLKRSRLQGPKTLVPDALGATTKRSKDPMPRLTNIAAKPLWQRLNRLEEAPQLIRQHEVLLEERLGISLQILEIHLKVLHR